MLIELGHPQRIFHLITTNKFFLPTQRTMKVTGTTKRLASGLARQSSVLIPKNREVLTPKLVGQRAALRTMDGQKRLNSSQGGATTVSLAYSRNCVYVMLTLL
jgi:hypothetical protein